MYLVTEAVSGSDQAFCKRVQRSHCWCFPWVQDGIFALHLVWGLLAGKKQIKHRAYSGPCHRAIVFLWVWCHQCFCNQISVSCDLWLLLCKWSTLSILMVMWLILYHSYRLDFGVVFGEGFFPFSIFLMLATEIVVLPVVLFCSICFLQLREIVLCSG